MKARFLRRLANAAKRRLTRAPRFERVFPMAIDAATVRKVAHLARIRVAEDRLEPLAAELSGILAWIEQLNEVDTEGVQPMASTEAVELPMRDDVVTDGGDPQAILSNAPKADRNFFVVPKVVE
jgi:aspartyl-tRNA(Asn)/glutamyl-tRNA(Gln) amidotransferase subunit C